MNEEGFKSNPADNKQDPVKQDERRNDDRRPVNNRNPNVDELLTKIVHANATRDQIKLRPYLTGKVLFELTDTKKYYVFDWATEKLRTEQVSSATIEENVDCTISMNEITLQKIAAGDINPQIAMLSNYVNIKGKVSLAVYLFNLIVH